MEALTEIISVIVGFILAVGVVSGIFWRVGCFFAQLFGIRIEESYGDYHGLFSRLKDLAIVVLISAAIFILVRDPDARAIGFTGPGWAYVWIFLTMIMIPLYFFVLPFGRKIAVLLSCVSSLLIIASVGLENAKEQQLRSKRDEDLQGAEVNLIGLSSLAGLISGCNENSSTEVTSECKYEERRFQSHIGQCRRDLRVAKEKQALIALMPLEDRLHFESRWKTVVDKCSIAVSKCRFSKANGTVCPAKARVTSRNEDSYNPDVGLILR